MTATYPAVPFSKGSRGVPERVGDDLPHLEHDDSAGGHRPRARIGGGEDAVHQEFVRAESVGLNDHRIGPAGDEVRRFDEPSGPLVSRAVVPAIDGGLPELDRGELGIRVPDRPGFSAGGIRRRQDRRLVDTLMHGNRKRLQRRWGLARIGRFRLRHLLPTAPALGDTARMEPPRGCGGSRIESTAPNVPCATLGPTPTARRPCRPRSSAFASRTRSVGSRARRRRRRVFGCRLGEGEFRRPRPLSRRETMRPAAASE